MKPLAVISTKLKPPMIREPKIRRAGLYRKLKQINQYPLTIIHAGAGYGKSTALALFVQDVKEKVCWYDVSSQDDDFFQFYQYMIHSIQQLYPSFGQVLLERAYASTPFSKTDELVEWSALFINELAALSEEVIVIIDNFHHVEKSMSIQLFMEYLTNYYPSNLHLVLSSRNKPQWNWIPRLKMNGHMLEITQDYLALTKEEAELLFIDFYHLTLCDEELARIFQLTEGWAIALEVVAQQLMEGTHLHKIITNRSSYLEVFFQYITLEVLRNQSSAVQSFLEQTSILEELSPEACNYILDIENAEEMMQYLNLQNLFIIPTGHQQYRYHPLFQELLEKRCKDMQSDRFVQLNKRAARYYENRGLFEMSLYHLEKLVDFGGMARILHMHGMSMLKKGKIHYLLEKVTALPEIKKDEHYLLWLIEAEVMRLCSQYERAEFCYNRLFFFSRQYDDKQIMSRAHEGKARIYLDTLQPGKAERHLQAAIQLRENSYDVDEEEIAELHQLLVENLINSGKTNQAEQWLTRIKQINTSKNGNLLARLYLRTGRLMMAKEILQERQKEYSFNQETHIPQFHRETELILSLVETYIGNAEESKRLAQAAIGHGIQIKSSYIEACGWIRMGHAIQLLSTYDPALSIQCYETALTIMGDIKNSRGKAEPYLGLCLYYAGRKDDKQAVEYGRLAMEETEKVHDQWLTAYIRLSIAIAYVYTESWTMAEQELDEAEQLFWQCGDAYGLTLVTLWKVQLAYSVSSWHVFEEECIKLFQKIQLGQYEYLLLKRTLYGPVDVQQFVPILLEAQKRNIGQPFVSKTLKELGYHDLLTHPGYTLKISTLGQFKVLLGNQEVKDKGWQRGKAKELFQLFLTKRNKLLQKREIIEILWPEQDEKTADRDFKVALNALNSVLEPERKARSQSFFIKRVGSSYGINDQSAYMLDTTMFEQWMLSGLEERNQKQAKEYLKRGLTLYKGDYLPERKFHDWCLNERERLLVLFLRGAEKYAQLSIATEAYHEAIYWCEKILEKDRTWEEAYRLLMYCYYMHNNRPQSLKWYKKCCDVLQEEIDVEPLAATKEMYKMIMEATDIILSETDSI